MVNSKHAYAEVTQHISTVKTSSLNSKSLNLSKKEMSGASITFNFNKSILIMNQNTQWLLPEKSNQKYESVSRKL